MTLWKNISNIGIQTEMSDTQVRRAQLTNRLLLIAILMGCTYVPIFIKQGSAPLLTQISILLGTLLSLFFFVKNSKHQTAAVLLCLLLITHLLISGILIEGGTGRYFLILFSILGFAMVRSVIYGVIIFVYSVIAFFIAEFAHYFTVPLVVRSSEHGELVYVINMLLIFMGCFFLIFHYKRGNILYEINILRQKDKIESQHSALSESHREIQDSIRYAKRIQNAILPPVKVLDKLLKDYFVVYKPKDTVAGDFYWIESQAGVTYLAVADCTGHGVPGAMVSVICNSALNRAVREMKLTDTAQILDKVRELIIQEFEKSEEDVKDGMDITLCAIKGNDLQFSGANNSLWIIRDKEHISLRADKQPIGKFEFSRPFSSKNFELQKGDQVYLTTDGYPDQFGGEKGKKLKSKNMIDLLIKFNDESMPDQQAKLDAFIEEWKGDYEQVDDICVLGFRV